MRIGEESLGELARSELAAARRDPRMDRDRGGMVADFWDAVEEAERGRTFAIMGLHELQGALERAEKRLGVLRNNEGLKDEQLQELQVMWARAEIARIEIANDHPQQNAQALISLNSALDAMVEEFVASLREMQTRFLTDELIRQTTEKVPEAAEVLTDALRDQLAQAGQPFVAAKLPDVSRLRGSGASRYETPLADVWLAAPADRPLPADLDEALREVGAIRDVLIHRAGRVDSTALKQAPTLKYDDGELVRISGDDYRRYSAAICCYAQEISFRVMRNWPEVTDETHGPNLANWRNYYKIGA